MLHLLAYLALAILGILLCAVCGFILGLDILGFVIKLAIKYWPITLIVLLIFLLI